VSDRPFLLSATVDFPDDLELGVYTPALIDEMMRTLRDVGVRRVNWLDYGSAIDRESPLFNPILVNRAFGPASLATLGEPLPVAVRAAHRHGLEFIAVMKPFAGASIITWPTGSPDGARPGLRRIGGTLHDAFGYLERNPDWRIRRRPDTAAATEPRRSQDIAAIRLTKSDATPTRLDREHLEIWTSPANWQYRRRDIGFDVADEVRPAPDDVRDYFGRSVTRRGDPVRSLTLTLREPLDEPFVLVTTTFDDSSQTDFRNTAVAMVEALDASGRPLPLVVATRSATAEATRDFRTGGLEFDCGYGPFLTALDVDNSAVTEGWDTPQGGCIAFALGRNDVLSGGPDESRPEVRAAWLDWVRWLLAAGVDGIDVRISAHGTHTDEPFAYGSDPIERGDRYTTWLGRARALALEAGKQFAVHLHTEAFRPDPVHGEIMGFPANLEFQWQRWLENGWLDHATLRTQWYESLGPTNNDDLPALLDDPVVADTIARARAAGVPLHLNRYAMEGGRRRTGDRLRHYLDDLEFVVRDGRLQGFDVYEFWVLARPSADGTRIEPTGDFLPKLREQVERLGLA
jgi:hypothetical protein